MKAKVGDVLVSNHCSKTIDNHILIVAPIAEILYKPSFLMNCFHVGVRINSPVKSSTLKTNQPPISIWDDEIDVGKYETIYTLFS